MFYFSRGGVAVRMCVWCSLDELERAQFVANMREESVGQIDLYHIAQS